MNTVSTQNEIFRLHIDVILRKMLMQEFAILITTTPFPDGAFLHSLTTSFCNIFYDEQKNDLALSGLNWNGLYGA